MTSVVKGILDLGFVAEEERRAKENDTESFDDEEQSEEAGGHGPVVVEQTVTNPFLARLLLPQEARFVEKGAENDWTRDGPKDPGENALDSDAERSMHRLHRPQGGHDGGHGGHEGEEDGEETRNHKQDEFERAAGLAALFDHTLILTRHALTVGVVCLGVDGLFVDATSVAGVEIHPVVGSAHRVVVEGRTFTVGVAFI